MPSRRQSQNRAPKEKVTPCVLLAPGNLPAPSQLIEALKRRGVEVTLVGEGADLSPLLDVQPAPILVLVEPDRLECAADLARSALNHCPGLHIWRYAQSSDRPLAPYRLPPSPTGQDNAVTVVSPDRPADRPWYESVPLTGPELSMLLGKTRSH